MCFSLSPEKYYALGECNLDGVFVSFSFQHSNCRCKEDVQKEFFLFPAKENIHLLLPRNSPREEKTTFCKERRVISRVIIRPPTPKNAFLKTVSTHRSKNFFNYARKMGKNFWFLNHRLVLLLEENCSSPHSFSQKKKKAEVGALF